MTYADIISSIGVFFILLAFFLNTFNRLSDKSKIYFGLNILGSLLAFYGSILIGSAPFAVLEGAWTIVASIGLIRIFMQS